MSQFRVESNETKPLAGAQRCTRIGGQNKAELPVRTSHVAIPVRHFQFVGFDWMRVTSVHFHLEQETRQKRERVL